MSLLVEQHGAVRVLTLNRPEKANSLNRALNAALGLAFQAAADDDDVRVLVLTAAGRRHFCAGMDLTEFAADGTDDPRPAAPPVDVTVFTERPYPKPVIAAVNGVAVGGGFGLVLACDIVLAAHGATFGIPEVTHGLVGVGVTSRAVGRLPLPVVLRMGLTGRSIDAETARSLQLVSEVVAPEALLTDAIELAQSIAAFSPPAVAAVKAVALAAAGLDAPDMAALRARAAHVVAGSDAKAGAAAFAARPRG